MKNNAALSNWGVQTTGTIPFATDFVCPHCGTFSYFCNGNFLKHAATDWRRAVVGFTHHHGFSKEWNQTTIVGIAVFLCPCCSQQFKMFLTDEVIGAYKTDCPCWP